MKILFVISSVGSGGAERVLSTLANYFVENLKYEVTIATYNTKIEDFYTLNKKITRIRFGVKNGNNLFTKIVKRIIRLRRIRRIVQDTHADIVIPLMAETNIETLLATIGIKIPILVVEHNNYWFIKSRSYRIIRLFFYQFANKTILLTERDKLIYDKYLNNCVVIPNPILLECSNNLSKREKTLLCVGRLIQDKQFDHILYIFSKILKQSNWNLTIAGNGTELDQLKAYANQLGIIDRVNFAGNVVDMSRLYQQSGLFILCSSYEGFPMALGEAMFCGMPVVSYDCPTGPSEIIENEISGILIEHNNKNALEKAISSLINNEEKRIFLGENAKKRIQEFSIQTIGKKWKLLINNTVLKGSPN